MLPSTGNILALRITKANAAVTCSWLPFPAAFLSSLQSLLSIDFHLIVSSREKIKRQDSVTDTRAGEPLKSLEITPGAVVHNSVAPGVPSEAILSAASQPWVLQGQGQVK